MLIIRVPAGQPEGLSEEFCRELAYERAYARQHPGRPHPFAPAVPAWAYSRRPEAN